MKLCSQLLCVMSLWCWLRNWWLTHCGLVMAYGDIGLMAPWYYPNQCWLTISKVLWLSSDRVIIRRSEDTHKKIRLKNGIFKIASRSPMDGDLNAVCLPWTTLCHKVYSFISAICLPSQPFIHLYCHLCSHFIKPTLMICPNSDYILPATRADSLNWIWKIRLFFMIPSNSKIIYHDHNICADNTFCIESSLPPFEVR